MDYKMSTKAHAIRAIALLRATGHEDASMLEDPRQQVIRISAYDPGTDFEVRRLIHAVDPAAHPLG